MVRTLTQTVPTISLTLNVNINADRTFLLIVGLLWMVWLSLANSARLVGRCVVWVCGVVEDLHQAIVETLGMLALMVVCPMGQTVAG